MHRRRHPDDESWYNGPPYAVVERVFDEYDFEGCVAMGGSEDYFDDSGAFQGRTADPITPMGESTEESVGDLYYMLSDAMIRCIEELDHEDES